MTAVDTPGDLIFLDCLLTGRTEPKERCVKFNEVPKRVVGPRQIVRLLCPKGCVRTVDEIKKKCKVKYYEG